MKEPEMTLNLLQTNVGKKRATHYFTLAVVMENGNVIITIAEPNKTITKIENWTTESWTATCVSAYKT